MGAEEVQEQRFGHVCRICGKACVSGRSLGGHMRVHLAAKAGIKAASEGGGRDRPNVDPGRGLVDGSRAGASCAECGKEFPTPRALWGHMRSHSIKNKSKNKNGTHRCGECGKGFDSIRAVFGHMKSHSKKRSRVHEDVVVDVDVDDLFPIRRKRSMIRYNIATAYTSSSDLNESNSSGAVFEVGDVKEVAEILIMLSKGARHWSEFDGFACGVDEDEGVCEFDGLDSSCVAKDGIQSGSADDLDKDFSVSNAANEESSGFKCKSKEHECHVCFKVFPSGQALGGHKRAHYNNVGFGVSAESKNREVMMTMPNPALMIQELGGAGVEVDDDDDGDALFDLNFPVRINDGGAKRVDVDLSLWWAEIGREVLTN